MSLLIFAASLAAACSQNTGSQTAGRSEPAAAEFETAARASAAPPKPHFDEVTIPSGTVLRLKLATAIASDRSKVEDPVRATVSKPITIQGRVVMPAGTEVVGAVLNATPSGRVKGRASLAFRFDRLRLRDELHDIRTSRVSREAAATKKKDAKKVGLGAGAGAVIGAIAGGAKGAGIGALIGAGAGTGVVVATKGDEVRLAAGTIVTTTMEDALVVRVPIA
jgi:hypothetical protein